MDDVVVLDEDKIAKEIKVFYIQAQMLRILKESGLSEDEQLSVLHEMIKTRKP